MNIKDLKYLVAIADHSHFGKAAAACFVSQPALSMQIKKLENFLDVQLIERNKSALLTDVGKLITEQARDILCRVDAIKQMARQAKDPFGGELRLGVIPTLGAYLLPHIIPGLSKIFPKLTIYLVEEKTHTLIDKLKNGKLDGALFGLPILEEDFMALPLFAEEILLAVPSNHPFAKRSKIKYSDLENKTLLLLEDGHCLRDQALSLCHSMHASVDTVFQATSLETLRYMIASKTGITLMPKLACKNNEGICYIPFNLPKPVRTIGMIWRPSSAKKILLENMVVHIRKLLGKKQIVKILNTSIICHKNKI